MPAKGVDDSYLKHLTIAPLPPKKSFTFLNIKKKPLFYHPDHGYGVMDVELYNQAYYRGLYFNMFYDTSMVKDFKGRDRDFAHYTGEMSTEVLERICFNAIIGKLKGADRNSLFFDDDNKPGYPDAYHRSKKTVSLVECKGYLFPERLMTIVEYSGIKEHIKNRFIEDEGQEKGITQIASQIQRLKKGEFDWDKEFCANLRDKRITVYPIICHDELNYHMLGLNDYLEGKFREQLSKLPETGYLIKPVTLINMKTLFELGSRGCSKCDLESLIDRYHNIINNRRKRAGPEFSNGYYLAYSGFDEIYYSIFKPSLIIEKPVRNGKMWTYAIGLTQESLDEII